MNIGGYDRVQIKDRVKKDNRTLNNDISEHIPKQINQSSITSLRENSISHDIDVKMLSVE